MLPAPACLRLPACLPACLWAAPHIQRPPLPQCRLPCPCCPCFPCINNPAIRPEGIKAPVNEKAAEIKTTIVSSFVMSGAACLVGGFLLGRFLPRGGGSGSGKGR